MCGGYDGRLCLRHCKNQKILQLERVASKNKLYAMCKDLVVYVLDMPLCTNGNLWRV
jgi:hypothetical protein